jgi:spore coat polysaccharide biosynthesis predicted glycosyltransferase SpsG
VTKLSSLKKIFCVTEANPTIGYGHLYRCLALLDILAEQFNYELLLFETPEPPVDAPYTCFTTLADIETFLQQQPTTDAVLLFDSYKIAPDYVQRLRELGFKTVAINDLPEDALPADVVINHSFGLHPEEFDLPAYSTLLLGEKYFLLRKPFLEAKFAPAASTRKQQITICFGGADFHRLSIKYLSYLRQLNYRGKRIVLTNATETIVDIKAAQAKGVRFKTSFFSNFCCFYCVNFSSDRCCVSPTLPSLNYAY